MFVLAKMLGRAARPLRSVLTATSLFSRGLAIKVGDAFPTGVKVQTAFKENHAIEEFSAKGNVLFVSLPGAFTPT